MMTTGERDSLIDATVDQCAKFALGFHELQLDASPEEVAMLKRAGLLIANAMMKEFRKP